MVNNNYNFMKKNNDHKVIQKNGQSQYALREHVQTLRLLFINENKESIILMMYNWSSELDHVMASSGHI